MAGVVVDSVHITAGIGLGSSVALDSCKTVFSFLVVPKCTCYEIHSVTKSMHKIYCNKSVSIIGMQESIPDSSTESIPVGIE